MKPLRRKALQKRVFLPHYGKIKAPRWGTLRKEVSPKTFAEQAESDLIAGEFNISEEYIMEKSLFEEMGGTYHMQGDYII